MKSGQPMLQLQLAASFCSSHSWLEHGLRQCKVTLVSGRERLKVKSWGLLSIESRLHSEVEAGRACGGVAGGCQLLQQTHPSM